MTAKSETNTESPQHKRQIKVENCKSPTNQQVENSRRGMCKASDWAPTIMHTSIHIYIYYKKHMFSII